MGMMIVFFLHGQKENIATHNRVAEGFSPSAPITPRLAGP